MEVVVVVAMEEVVELRVNISSRKARRRASWLLLVLLMVFLLMPPRQLVLPLPLNDASLDIIVCSCLLASSSLCRTHFVLLFGEIR
jgi:hypothetical protein